MTTVKGLDRATLAFVIVLAAATWLRIEALRFSPLDLYFDEAQYWTWSRSLEWGYFTKPPLVAWVIAATTSIFGDAEWAVRLGSPIAQSLAALAVFALGRSVYGAWTGFWSGVGWLVLPGVWLSSSVISTDALLLPMWALALFAMWRLTNTRAWAWAIWLGVAIGLGLQAKYAMLYFPICMVFAARASPAMRQALGSGRGIVAILIALAIIAPNLYWNFQHGFVTAQHTAANASLDPTDLFNLDELWEFLSSQAGVLGPIVFLALLWFLWRALTRSAGLSTEDKFLLAFIVPPLAIVSIIAFISRANANWAAAMFPAAIVWVTGSLIGGRMGRRVLAAAIAVNVLLGAAVAIGPITLDPDFTARVKGVRESRAWEETAREIAVRAAGQPGEAPFTAVLVDDRSLYFELTYYWRVARQAGAPVPPLRMWVVRAQAGNAAEASDPMRAEEGARVLIVHSSTDYLPFVAGDFTVFRTVEHLAIPLGGGYRRDLEISVGEGFAPAPRDAAFERRLLQAAHR